MDIEVKSTSGIDADIDSITSVEIHHTLNADSSTLHHKESSTDDSQLLNPTLDMDSNKEVAIDASPSASIRTVDASFDCYAYNILDRWQQYDYDLQSNVCNFYIELPSR